MDFVFAPSPAQSPRETALGVLTRRSTIKGVPVGRCENVEQDVRICKTVSSETAIFLSNFYTFLAKPDTPFVLPRLRPYEFRDNDARGSRGLATINKLEDPGPCAIHVVSGSPAIRFI